MTNRAGPKEALDALTDVDEAGQISLATPGDQLALLLYADDDDEHQEQTAAARPAVCPACEFPNDENHRCRATTLTEEENAA